MECRTDGLRRNAARGVHKMAIPLGHFKRMMTKSVCDGELPLSSTGKPGSVGVSEGMKDNTLSPVLNFVFF